MENGQTGKRKPIVVVLVLLGLGCASYVWWNRGPLFAPQPDVGVTAAPAAQAPETVASAAPELTISQTGVTPTAAPQAPDISVPEVTVGISSEPAPQPAPATPTAPEVDVTGDPQAPAAQEPAGPVAPRFDLVRVEEDGTAVIAGQAGTGGMVYLVVDGQRVDATETPTQDNSAFVLFADLPPKAQPQVLQLALVTQDGQDVISEEKVFLSPRLVAAVDADAVTIDTAPAAAPAEDTPVETATPAPADDQTVSVDPQVLIADADGDVRVLASPVATVALDTIQYDLEGEVDIGGRAVGDGFVRVYLDNKPITTSRIESDGFWNISLPNVDTGVYTLRVDELDETGTVTSRVETPFQRESPEALTAFSEPGSAFEMKAMTVQPGTTLWAMAVAKYGDGTQFMKVFEANRDTIRDPNLIFPGQIFDLPD